MRVIINRHLNNNRMTYFCKNNHQESIVSLIDGASKMANGRCAFRRPRQPSTITRTNDHCQDPSAPVADILWTFLFEHTYVYLTRLS